MKSSKPLTRDQLNKLIRFPIDMYKQIDWYQFHLVRKTTRHLYVRARFLSTLQNPRVCIEERAT